MREIKLSSQLYEDIENLCKYYKFGSVEVFINFMLSNEVCRFMDMKDIIEQMQLLS